MPVPSVVVPSLKMTVPVGMGPVAGMTEAVRVTCVPKFGLFELLIRPVVSSVRATVVRHFMLDVQDDPVPHILTAARHRMADRNVRPSEVEWLARKVAETEQAAAAAG